MPFSVNWEEEDGSPREERTRDGFRATRTLLCAWEDRKTLRDELLAFPGHLYPHSNVQARCTGVSSTPWGQFNRGAADGTTGYLAAPSLARLQATYETPRTNLAQLNPNPNTPGDVEMISEDMEPTLEGVALWTPEGFEFTYDAARTLKVKKGAEPTILAYKEKYTFVRHHLAVAPNTLENLIGRCNNQPLITKLLGMTLAPETALFAGCKIGVVSDQLGNRKFTATYQFHYQPWGWNKFISFNATTGELEYRSMYIGNLATPAVPGVAIKVAPLANFSGL